MFSKTALTDLTNPESDLFMKKITRSMADHNIWYVVDILRIHIQVRFFIIINRQMTCFW